MLALFRVTAWHLAAKPSFYVVLEGRSQCPDASSRKAVVVPNDSDNREFSVITASLENERRLIAAGKLQRWDVVKWTLTVNFALAAVSAALRETDYTIHLGFFLLSVFAAAAGHRLVVHYNDRMTSAREAAWFLDRYMAKEYKVDISSIAHQSTAKPPSNYDRQELFWFPWVIYLSVAPTLVQAVRAYCT